jgi:hypothetical protein
MTERVGQLGGTLKVGNTHPRGVIVQVWIPTIVEIVKGEQVHADPAA